MIILVALKGSSLLSPAASKGLVSTVGMRPKAQLFGAGIPVNPLIFDKGGQLAAHS
ncbi:hypothetical protein [Nitrospira sp. Ecomares 2.1]